jgi:NADP-dependent 3-hydroxy acid dehydrogenase YdfG
VPAIVRLGQADQSNLSSAVYVCHAFAGHLLDQKSGSVINVASVAGVAASR